MVGNVIKWNETGKKIDFTPFIRNLFKFLSKDLAIDSLNKNEPLFLPLGISRSMNASSEMRYKSCFYFVELTGEAS